MAEAKDRATKGWFGARKGTKTLKQAISEDQLIASLSQSPMRNGENIDPAPLQKLFALFGGGAEESDSDGEARTIGYREFVFGAAIMANAKPREKLDLVFALCDEDKGGTLSGEELTVTFEALLSCVRKLALSPRPAEGEAAFAQALTATVLAEADKDQSGELDKREFIKWVDPSSAEESAQAGAEPSAAAVFVKGLLFYLRPGNFL